MCIEQTKGIWVGYNSNLFKCSRCGQELYCDRFDGGILPDTCPTCKASMEGADSNV